jgi:uncharacterized membrane protein
VPIEVIDVSQRAPDQPGALSSSDTAPLWQVRLTPYRSLSPTGFVWVIGLLSGGLAIPLLGVFGTPVLWGLLPFLILTVGGLWYFIMRNTRDGHITEDLTLWNDRLTLTRIDPKGQRQDWEANPYWVKIRQHSKPVEHYLTLQGGPREVELGAFLSPEERKTLQALLSDELRALNRQ